MQANPVDPGFISLPPKFSAAAEMGNDRHAAVDQKMQFRP
jgi:hypothetical protein